MTEKKINLVVQTSPGISKTENKVKKSATQLIDIELLKKREKEREKKRRQRAKIKSDPKKHLQSKKKENQRSEARRATGKIKKVADLKPREHRAQQKKWRESKRRSRIRNSEKKIVPLEDVKQDQMEITSTSTYYSPSSPSTELLHLENHNPVDESFDERNNELSDMEENILPDVCRACMTENGDFQSVFMLVESTGLNIHLAEMIMAYASVQITLGDGLPQQICTKCVKKVSEFYCFKLKCEESDRNLRSKFDKSLHSIIADQTDAVIIKSEICEEDTKIQIKTEDIETDHFTENEDNELVDQLPGTEINEIEKNIFFERDVSNKCFQRNDILTKHKKLHEYKEYQSDDECQSNDTIKDHQQVIEFVDLNCYKTEESDTEHLADHRKLDDLTCEACNKRFTKPSNLRRHMIVHAAVKPYNCNFCNKGFGRADQLSRHLNIHSGIKPHVCKVCAIGFNQISNFKDHMQTHKGPPFLCSTCGKGFNHLGNLKQHKVRHSGVKAHICNICSNSFASKGELSTHSRKHTGVRPFVCSECNNGFTTLSSLTNHKRIHSGEKPYECDVCNMKFSRSGILAKHKRTHKSLKKIQ